jgi:hypothetical protein
MTTSLPSASRPLRALESVIYQYCSYNWTFEPTDDQGSQHVETLWLVNPLFLHQLQGDDTSSQLYLVEATPLPRNRAQELVLSCEAAWV